MGTPISSVDLLRRIEVLERLLNIIPAPEAPLFPAIEAPRFGPLTPQPVKYVSPRCPSCGQVGFHNCLGSSIGSAQ